MIITLAQWTMTPQSLMQYWQLRPQPTNLAHSHQVATIGLLVNKRQHCWDCKMLLKNIE
jgi:hypothetical protein